MNVSQNDTTIILPNECPNVDIEGVCVLKTCVAAIIIERHLKCFPLFVSKKYGVFV